MKKFALFGLIASFLTAGELFAQYNFDVGFKMGASNYLGDIGGKEKTRRDWILDMKLNQTRTAWGAFARYKFSPILSGSVHFTYLRLKGDDKLSTNPGRVGRNLNFRNDIKELAFRGEAVFFEENDVGSRGRYRLDFKTYGFAGVNIFHHNPKGLYQGEWIPLRPLMTENVKYNNWQIGIPAGIGFYFTEKRKHRYGFEMQWVTTFTDYLDDISGFYVDPAELTSPLSVTMANRRDELGDVDGVPHSSNYGPPSNVTNGKRGDPSRNDSYLFMTFNYSYVIRGYNNFYRQNYNWLTGPKGGKRVVRAKF